MDLWSADSSLSPSSRASVVGFASVGMICTSNRYSIIEETGGFSSVLVCFLLFKFKSHIIYLNPIVPLYSLL